MKALLFWAPRILAVCFALFLGLFALDAFSAGESFWYSLAAFGIHLTPTFLVVLSLVLAWKRDWLGFLFFLALGVTYIVMAWGKFSVITYLLISGPLFLIGLLFLAHWFVAREATE